MNLENPRPSSFVEQCPKKEREQEKEGHRLVNTEREREREREIASSNPFLRLQTQKSSNPFIIDRREP